MSGIPILPPLAALALFVVWTLLLVLSIGVWRVSQILTLGKGPDDFPSGTKHGGEAYWRLNRAHMNAVENLPMFAAVVLAGTYLQIDSMVFQLLPSLVLYARVVQSAIHISSGSRFAVTLRFLAFGVQVFSMFLMAAGVIGATGVAMPW